MRIDQDNPCISVIIVNWNGLALLEECLGSLEGQTFRDFETILVDNGSSDGSAEWVRSHYPNVRVLKLNSNTGFSAGNNTGLKLARGEFIALLNNDTRVEPDWLDALYTCLQSDPNIAACDSRVLYNDQPHFIWSSGGSYTVAGSVFARLNREPDQKDDKQPADVFIAIACAALYRKKVIDEIGFFDEDYFNGYEDVDWSFRAHLFGYRIVNEPRARVYHKVSSTQVHNSPEFVYHGQRNVSVTFIKNMPGSLLWKYWPLHLIYMGGSFFYFAKVGQLPAFLRAKRDLIHRLPALWRKRRALQGKARFPSAVVETMLEKRWLGLKIKKFENKNHAAG